MQNHPKTRLQDPSKTFPRFQDRAKIFKGTRFGSYHSIPLAMYSYKMNHDWFSCWWYDFFTLTFLCIFFFVETLLSLLLTYIITTVVYIIFSTKDLWDYAFFILLCLVLVGVFINIVLGLSNSRRVVWIRSWFTCWRQYIILEKEKKC